MLWRINRIQLMSMTSSSCLALMYWYYPRTAVEHADLDAQWSILGVVLVSFFMAYCHGRLNRRFPTLIGIDMLTTVFGHVVGRFVGFIYFVVYLTFMALSVHLFANILKYVFWPNTPLAVLIIVLLLVAGVGAWYGLESLARVSFIVFILVDVLALFVFISVLIQTTPYGMPLKLTSLSRTLDGIYHLMPLYLGFNLFLVFSPYYQRTSAQQDTRDAMAVAAAMAVSIIVPFIAVILVIGWEGAARLEYPLVFVMRLARFHGVVIERFGLLVAVVATAYNILFTSNNLWGMSVIAARMTGSRDGAYKRFVWPLAGVTLLIALSIQSTQRGFMIVDQIFAPISWLLLVVEPPVKLLVAKMRGLQTQQPVDHAPSSHLQQRGQPAEISPVARENVRRRRSPT